EPHLQFFLNLQYYYADADIVCTHGGVDPEAREFSKQVPETFLWGGLGFPDHYNQLEKVIYGHRNNGVLDRNGWPCPAILPNGTFGIDTISHGVLTAIRLPELRIFQSARYPVNSKLA